MAPLLAALLFLCLRGTLSNNCPPTLPEKIGSLCLGFQEKLYNLKDNRAVCENYKAKLGSAQSQDVLDWLRDKVRDLIDSKRDNYRWWMGIKLDDGGGGFGKKTGDRKWSFDYYNDEKFVQKDYKFWREEGGPQDASLRCTKVIGKDNFTLDATDCENKHPFLCMRNDENDGKCKADPMPYLQHGSYCIAAVNLGTEYSKASGGCYKGKLAPIRDEEQRTQVMLAAMNSLFGGTILQNLQRNGPYQWYDPNTAYMPPDEAWLEGEPRDGYDCAGLALTSDGSLKLKTTNCQFLQTGFCYIQELCCWTSRK